MDIDRVRYFNVVAETGSLVKASEILHVSQPALSKALRVLEAESGLKLVEADGRGLRLTEVGRRFREETLPLLRQWMDVPKRIRDHHKESPSRIASFEVFTTYFLSHLLRHVNLSSLEVHEYGPGRIEQSVAEGRADLGITYLPVPRAGVEFTEVTKVKMGVFGLEKFAKLDFGALPFAIPVHPAEGTPSKVIGLDGWPDHRFERDVKFRVTMMESAMELCRKGHAVAFLPRFVVDIHNADVLADRRLKELPAPLAQRDCLQSVFLIRRHGAAETKLDREVARSLRSLR